VFKVNSLAVSTSLLLFHQLRDGLGVTLLELGVKLPNQRVIYESS